MITDRFLTGLGVDPAQWRTLVRASWRILWRSTPGMAIQANKAKFSGLIFGLLLYGVVGIFLAVISAVAPSPGSAAFLCLSFIIVYLGNLVLLEFGSSIVSPDDVLILGTRPVSSRTYFFSRLTIVAIFVSIYAVMLGGPATLVFLFRFGPVSAVVWVLTMLAESYATGMGMIVVYTKALQYFPASRIRSILGYVQMGLSFSIYGGFAILQKQMQALSMGLDNRPPWTSLLPSSWFAGIIDLATGSATARSIPEALAAGVLLIVLWKLLAGKIALEYMDSASAAAVTVNPLPKQQPASSPLRFRFLRRPEDRAIALLIARQFRYDSKFKMGVLAIIPLTLLYMYQGISGSGTLSDPFVQSVQSAHDIGSSSLLYLGIVLFPVVLSQEISWSESYQASWIFFATPVNRGALVLAVRRILTGFFIIPYLALIAMAFLYFFGNPLHVLMHVLVLFLATNLLFLLYFLLSPRIPFSKQRGVNDRISLVTSMLIISPLLMIATMTVFVKLLYPSTVLYLAGVGSLILLSLGLELLLGRRARVATDRLEFSA